MPSSEELWKKNKKTRELSQTSTMSNREKLDRLVMNFKSTQMQWGNRKTVGFRMWILSACTNREQTTVQKSSLNFAQTSHVAYIAWTILILYFPYQFVTGNVENLHALELHYDWLCLCSFISLQKKKKMLWGCSFIQYVSKLTHVS